MGSRDRERKDKKRSKDRKDKSKKRRRERSYTPSTDSSSDEEDRRRKDAAKMAQKVERHLKKHGGLGGFGYTDDDNPFGDASLSERFVWTKKIEKEIEKGRDVRDLTAKAERLRQDDRLDEIAKVKKRREEREAEREALAQELEMIQRERSMAEAVDLEIKEEEFHMEQAKVRARQRLGEGRPKAIDLITNNLFLLDGFDPGEDDPVTIISSLNMYQLRELKSDVDEYAQLDSKDASHAAFWTALALIVDRDLAESTKQEEIDRARMRGKPPPAHHVVREAGWHESLDADVAVMLAGKTHVQLATLEEGIIEQLESGAADDPEYWEAVLRRLRIAKSKAVLREFHADIMQRHLDKVMAGADIPRALASTKDRALQARMEADRAHAAIIKQEEEESAGGEGRGDMEAGVKNEEEILLPDEEAIGHGDGAKADIADLSGAVASDTKEERLNAELEALAAVDIRHPLLGGGGPSRIQVGKDDEDDEEQQREIREINAARGEPRTWDDLDEDERTMADITSEEGLYSPRPLPPEHIVGHDVVPEEEDTRLLGILRSQVKIKESQEFRQAAAAAAAAAAAGGSSSVDADRLYRQMVSNPRSAASLLGGTSTILKNLVESGPSLHDTPREEQFQSAASRAMGDLATSGDAPFGGEIAVDSQVYWWHEKYRPRKPKYFNRVHTGYDWNKYNRTHYDTDNPPPKTVQGYKFNIFFPDLIDPSKAPSYTIEPNPDDEDGGTCILRFSAGPPYEDIAFKIVKKEWELNPKRGFRCVFERGMLQLYFMFKRQFYRR